jgi:exonuclease VII small subunit
MTDTIRTDNSAVIAALQQRVKELEDALAGNNEALKLPIKELQQALADNEQYLHAIIETSKGENILIRPGELHCCSNRAARRKS